MEHKLTPVEWKIYNYLKEHTDEWIMQEDLAIALFYDEWDNQVSKATDFHNTALRKTITNAIRNLNNSPIIQKIILSSSKGVKIAEKYEIDKYIGRQINSVIRRLNRVKKIAKKASLDGQCKITFGKYERAIIEAFPKEEDKLNPKYKVGDIVYMLHTYYDQQRVKQYYPVKHRVKKVYIGKEKITYYLHCYPNGVPEKYLYPSLEEANAKIEELTCR